MALRLAQPALLIDLRHLESLRGIAVDEAGLRLGAMTRWREIQDSAEVLDTHPLLVEAVRHIAHYQIRNRGTVGGSLAHADPAAELPCIAVTCGASIRVLGILGEREILADEFFLGPLATALGDDEIILEVRFPRWPSSRQWGFQEFSRRQGDFALAGVAIFYDTDNSGRLENAHVGVFGVGQCATRLSGVESALNGRTNTISVAAEVARLAAAEVTPSDDLHASARYRRALVAVLLERAMALARGERA